MLSTTVARGPSRRLSFGAWLESPAWDGFWMLSGLWLLAILLVAHATGHVPLVPDLLTMGAMVLLWGGHILSPLVASWTNRDLRRFMLDHRRRFVVVPLAVLLGSVLLGALGDLGQWPDLPREVTALVNPRLFLFYLFVLWNTWHFAAQHFGVLSIYRRVSAQGPARTRYLDKAFCLGMTCVLLPRGLYIVSIGIQPMFGAIAYPIYHFAVFSICHWLIALGLASRLLDRQGATAAPRAAMVEQDQGRVSSRWVRWLLLLAFMSVAMYLVFHSGTFHGVLGIAAPVTYGQDSLFAYRSGVFQWWFGLLSGAYFGISFVHFAYDRYLYSFGRPEVRRWVVPYLFG
jgi:hypothetical protein